MIDAAPDAMIDAMPDAPVDAPPQFSVSSVATADGFTEVRQGSSNFFGVDFTAHLVIAGMLLDDVDLVMVGTLACPITSVTSSEVRCDLDVPHGYPPGSLTVVVHSPTLGSTTAPNPITITFITAGPDALPGGHGTRQSPFNLCEIGSVLFGSYAYVGDTIDLLSGTHHVSCGVGLDNGTDVRGAGAGVTILAGFGGFDAGYADAGDPNATMHASGFSVLDPSGPVIQLDHGPGNYPGLVVDGVAVLGGTSPAVRVSYDGQPALGAHHVEIRNLSYDGGGDAIDVPNSGGTMANLTIQNCGVGIHTEYQGTFDVDHLTIDGCAVGIRATRPDAQSIFDSASPTMTVTTAQIRAIEGVRIDTGLVAATDTSIVASGPYGVTVTNGRLALSASQVTADDTAIVTFFSTGDANLSVQLDASIVVGGRVGIDYDTPDYGTLRMRNSRAQGGDYGVIVENGFFQMTIDLAGGNDLVGGLFAYYDDWDHPAPFGIIDAVGTTLNGRSYAGQMIVGPVELAPDYKVVHLDATTQF
jgi:hypothetical protein